MTAAVYFEQSELWGNQPEPYQVQVMADILDLLPDDVGSVLDVGCGDGLITNALPPHIKVVGLDPSPQALRHVRRDTRGGTISAIPFPDRSFDVVMTTDVLEHLPPEVLAEATQELTRVARKYIIVCVPHQEQWKANFTRCASCGHTYHINHHQRSWSEVDLARGLMPAPWRALEVRYSGLFRPHNDPTVELRHKLGLWNVWPGAVCPSCNSKEQIRTPQQQLPVDKCLDCLTASEWWAAGNPGFAFRDRSEIMALFSCQGRPPRLFHPAAPATRRDNLCSVDFKNALQCVAGWTIGPLWPSYLASPWQVRCVDGLRLMRKCHYPNELAIRFPVQPTPVDELILDLTTNDAEAQINVIAYDALTEKRIPLERFGVARGSHQLRLSLGDAVRDCYADRFGFLLIISVVGNVVMRQANYVRAGQHGSDAVPWMYLAPGHQAYSQKANGYDRSWGFTSLEGGRLPLPIDLAEPGEMPASSEPPDDLKECLEATTTRHGKKRADHLLFQIEQHFAAQAQSESESATTAHLRLVENYHAVITHRAQRVLVISHMYPSRSQPGLGPFIHEQVSALRVNSGLDARVVCCTPYWFNTFNPVTVARAYARYRWLLDRPHWTSHDGVPVLYLPYMVGGFFRHWLHAATYCNAVMAASDWLRREFPFEVIHAHTSYLDGTAALALGGKFGIPYLITEHTGPFRLLTENRLIRRRTVQALTQARKVFCVSSALAGDVRAVLTPAQGAKVEVLHNGVDSALFYPPPRWEPKPEAPRFLSVMSLDDNKNPLLLVEAFRRLRTALPGARLDIVGQGPLQGKLAETLRSAGLEDAVTLLGFRTRSEVARLMRDGCDALVLPSNSETFGVVLIEALASGKPVVSTDCGGPRDIVTNPEVGALCPVGDVDALHARLREVAGKLGSYSPERIRQHAVERYDYFSLAARLANEYQLAGID